MPLEGINLRKITISNKQFVVLIILSSLALFVGDTAFGMAFQQVYQGFIGTNPAAGVEAVAFNALIAGIFFTIFFNWFFLTGNEKPLDGLKLGVLYGVLISVPMASGFYYFTVANTQYIGTIFLNMIVDYALAGLLVVIGLNYFHVRHTTAEVKEAIQEKPKAKKRKK